VVTGRPDAEHPRAGLASQRTELAWSRTGLAVFVCGAVLLRRLWPLERPASYVAAAAIGLGIAVWAAVLVVVGRWAERTGRDPGAPLRRTVVATVAFAIAGFAIGLVPPE